VFLDQALNESLIVMQSNFLLYSKVLHMIVKGLNFLLSMLTAGIFLDFSYRIEDRPEIP